MVNLLKRHWVMWRLGKIIFFLILCTALFSWGEQHGEWKSVGTIPTQQLLQSETSNIDSTSSAQIQIILPRPTATARPKPSPTDSTPWGVAEQINDVTWRMKVTADDRMATPQEVLQALNTYRQVHGAGALTWDDNLAAFAQTRAVHLYEIKSTDGHQGFKDYVASDDNVKKLGFWSLGENIAYGYKLYGVHIIEWIFAGDKPHDDNQLNKDWTHVGIGIDGTAIAILFGGSKI